MSYDNPIVIKAVLQKHILAVAVITLSVIALYGPTLKVPFYLDDHINIQEQLPQLNHLSLDNLLESAFGGYLKRRPLANLSFAFNRYIHGLRTPGYHVVNISIHLLNAILLYCLLFRLLKTHNPKCSDQGLIWTAATAALLWCVHPIQIQAVTYVVQRMTSMASLFFLCSFLCYLKARTPLKKHTQIALFVLSGLFWIFSMASKEIAFTLPWLILMYEWFFLKDLDTGWLKRVSPYILISGIFLFAAVCAIYGKDPWQLITGGRENQSFTALQRLLTQGRVVFIYIGLLIFPHPSRLTLNHDIEISQTIWEPITTLFSLAGIALILVLAVFAARKHRILSFSIVWFFSNLVIESLVSTIEPMFQHRMYLPSMFFFLPLAYPLFQRQNRKAAILTVTLVLAIFSFWTYQRNAVWQDPVAFWEDAAGKTPDHYRVYHNLGVSYLERGNYDKALGAFEKALALGTPYPTETYINMGSAHMRKGQSRQARELLEKAIQLNGNNYMAFDLLGTLNQKEGKYESAVRRYSQALRIKPDFAASYYHLGQLYSETGKLKKAEAEFQKAIEIRPRWDDAFNALGLVLIKQQDYESALAQFKKATTLDGTNYDAQFNLANAYSIMGQYNMAAMAYKTLLRLNNRDVEAMHNLGMLYLNHLQDIRQARFYFGCAVKTDPEYPQAELVTKLLSDL